MNTKPKGSSSTYKYQPAVANASPSDMLLQRPATRTSTQQDMPANIRIGSARAAFEQFNPKDQETFRPSGVIADTKAGDSQFENTPSALRAPKTIFGMKIADAILIGGLALATIAASTLAAPIVAIGLGATVIALTVDSIQHRNDDTTLLDRPGAVVKAAIVGGATALTGGLGSKALLTACVAVIAAETMVTDSGDARVSLDEIKSGVTSAVKDTWNWLKIAAVVVFASVIAMRRSVRGRVVTDLNRVRSISTNALSQLRALLKRK